tara:strand:+ start:9850 stop:10092 length:243 start_codon:yes stop_codon:yes gene_type:complete
MSALKKMGNYISEHAHLKDQIPNTQIGMIVKAVCDIHALDSVQNAEEALWNMEGPMQQLIRTVIKFIFEIVKKQFQDLKK